MHQRGTLFHEFALLLRSLSRKHSLPIALRTLHRRTFQFHFGNLPVPPSPCLPPNAQNLRSLRSSQEERKIRLFVFNHLQTFFRSFSLFARERNAISILFNHFHTLCKNTGGRPPPAPPKYARQSASARPGTRSRTERPHTDQANE